MSVTNEDMGGLRRSSCRSEDRGVVNEDGTGPVAENEAGPRSPSDSGSGHEPPVESDLSRLIPTELYQGEIDLLVNLGNYLKGMTDHSTDLVRSNSPSRPRSGSIQSTDVSPIPPYVPLPLLPGRRPSNGSLQQSLTSNNTRRRRPSPVHGYHDGHRPAFPFVDAPLHDGSQHIAWESDNHGDENSESEDEARPTGKSHFRNEVLGDQRLERRQFLKANISTTQFLHRAKVSRIPIRFQLQQFENSGNGSVQHILKAKYKQDKGQQTQTAIFEGVAPSLQPRKQHLSTWIHIQQHDLDFDHYISKIAEICKANERLRDPLTEFLQQLQADKEYSFQNGHNSRLLKPFCRTKTHTEAPKDGIILTLVAACFPFVILDAHSSHDATKPKAATAHPKLTLFQNKNSRSDHRIDRHQAICDQLGPDKDRCLHVDQLWLFTVNDELVITCSTMNESQIRGEVIAMAPPTDSAKIQVVTPNGRLWVIDSNSCSTWLDFTMHFASLAFPFDEFLQVKMNGQIIQHSSWHLVMEKSKEDIALLEIKRKPKRHPNGRTPLNHAEYSIEAIRRMIEDQTAEAFAAVSVQRGISPAPLANRSSPKVGIDVEEYARRLAIHCSRYDPSSHSLPPDTGGPEEKLCRAICLGLLALVKQLVDFGLPDALTATERKLLAVVADLYDNVTSCTAPPSDAPDCAGTKHLLFRYHQLFDFALMVEMNGCNRRVFRERGVDVPQSINEICRTVTIALEKLRRAIQNQAAFVDLDNRIVPRYSEVYRRLSEGMAKTIAEHEVVTPDGIAALLFSRLINMKVHGTSDVMDIYSNYLGRLDAEARLGEPSLGPLSRLRYFKFELQAYSDVQNQQLDVIQKMTGGLFPQTEDPYFLNAHVWNTDFKFGGVLRVLSSCQRTLNNRQHSLGQWLNDVNYIREECRARLDEVQDWRENAAVVFTVVAIVFLPMSFVASIFGMNTADVRDMRQTQWAFWSAAIPFTLLVVVLALYWVDVPPLRRWWQRRRGREVY